MENDGINHYYLYILIKFDIKPFHHGPQLSPSGARTSAAIYSLIESAKGNGLNHYEYLLTVFEQLPAASTQEDLKALLPHNLKTNLAAA